MCAHSVTLESFMDRDEDREFSNKQPRVVTPATGGGLLQKGQKSTFEIKKKRVKTFDWLSARTDKDNCIKDTSDTIQSC
jgi:hypothetical protein